MPSLNWNWSKLLLLALFLVGMGPLARAQELNIQLRIDAEQVQTQERQIFREMEQVFNQFINTRRWTNDEYEPEERIEGAILITLTNMPVLGQFSGNVLVQSSRPVYGVDHQTPLVTFVDREVRFDYLPGQPLIYNDNTYTSEITQLLAYYAYLILAYDYDSFSELGGQPYIDKLFQVVNAAQGSSGAGWSSTGDDFNRYWMSDNLNNTQFEPFRRAMYTYHRKGMDAFLLDPAKGRETILEALQLVQQTRAKVPVSVVYSSFFLAKKDELAGVFSVGERPQKQQAFDLLRSMDPTNTETYQRILK